MTSVFPLVADGAAEKLLQAAKSHAALYWAALLDDIVPFWVKHSPDKQHGGFFTCLDTNGSVFDKDKFVWLQGRAVWMFSKLFNTLPESNRVSARTRAEWLELARSGAEFLRAHGADASGCHYFSLTQQGDPLIAPYSIFSDCFAAMAFAQFFKASGLGWAKELAVKTFENIERRKEQPKGQWAKAVPGTRPFRSLSVYMIDMNLCLEMQQAIPELQVRERVQRNIAIVMEEFLDRERGFLRENISPLPEAADTFEGRLVNPGHTIEALWFIMDVVSTLQLERSLIDTCVDSIIRTLEFGWDDAYGGIFYFLDSMGKPPQQLEWDQKLWWVHVETLVALALAFRLCAPSMRDRIAAWYSRVHEYSWTHFPDAAHGEWFGYLKREGEPLLQLKGGKWKGFFHMPRAMLLCAQHFDEIARLSGQ